MLTIKQLRDRLLAFGREGGMAMDSFGAAGLIGKKAACEIDSIWSKPRSNGPISVIDMFSGCGGMSAGFLAVNGVIPAYTIRGAFDIFAEANRSYEQNIGVKPKAVDVGKIAASPAAIRRLRDECGKGPLVLIGCAPCQGFTSHRNKSGGDARNSLFSKFCDAALKLKPDVVLMENVPELLTDRYWHYAANARSRLERQGYYVNISVHNMAEFGVPQERFRALFVAMRRPFLPIMGFLSRKQFRSVRNAIGSLPDVQPGVADANDPMHVCAGHKPSTVEVIRRVTKNGGNRPPNIGPRCLQEARAKFGKEIFEDVYGRLWWDRPSITITGSSRNPASGRFSHPEQNRGLTAREAALLQGFPSGYTFAGSLDDVFLQIGNAVPPRFAAYVAGRVLSDLLSPQDIAEPFDKGVCASVGKSFSRVIPSLKAAGFESAA